MSHLNSVVLIILHQIEFILLKILNQHIRLYNSLNHTLTNKKNPRSFILGECGILQASFLLPVLDGQRVIRVVFVVRFERDRLVVVRQNGE